MIGTASAMMLIRRVISPKARRRHLCRRQVNILDLQRRQDGFQLALTCDAILLAIIVRSGDALGRNSANAGDSSTAGHSAASITRLVMAATMTALRRRGARCTGEESVVLAA